jgi:hypothetical protein
LKPTQADALIAGYRAGRTDALIAGYRAGRTDALIAGYRAGRTMVELGGEFGIDRRTVSTHLRRAGVSSRRGGLDQGQVLEAAGLYEAG